MSALVVAGALVVAIAVFGVWFLVGSIYAQDKPSVTVPPRKK